MFAPGWRSGLAGCARVKDRGEKKGKRKRNYSGISVVNQTIKADTSCHA
jgi:hypothetical protein